MTPSDVLERFKEAELVRMIAYQNLYGPVTPYRLDVLFARLGMDVLSPHLKRGKRTRLEDHQVMWSGNRSTQTPEEMLATAKQITARIKQRSQRRGVAPDQQHGKAVGNGSARRTADSYRR